MTTTAEQRWFLPLLMLGLLAWGSLVGVGAFLGPDFWGSDPRAAQIASEAGAENVPLAEGSGGSEVTPRLQRAFDYRKPLVVAVSVGLFLGMWGLALRSRRNRLRGADLQAELPITETSPP